MKTYRLFISGTVQGVSFRNFIKHRAESLNVRGYVRNLSDGRVEVVIEGMDNNIKQLIEDCNIGPIGAKVKGVEVKDMPNQGFKGFKIFENL